MAKISEYLKQILSARYGRDVRQSIHDAISAINEETEACSSTVENVPETLAIVAVKDRVKGRDISLPMSSEFILTDFGAYGNTEQNGTPTPDAPIDIKSVVVNRVDVSGTNQMPNEMKSQTIGGLTIDSNSERIKVTGTTTKTVKVNVYAKKIESKNGLFIKGATKLEGLDYMVMASNNSTGAVKYWEIGTNGYYIAAGWTIERVYIQQINANVTVNAEIQPQIVVGNVDLPFEPYQSQTVNLSAPITLNGIGGVCDYIDVKRGVKVQKFGVVVFDGSADEGWYTMDTATAGVKRLYTRRFPAKASASNNFIPNILCTHYKPTTPQNTYSKVEGITVSMQPSDGGNTYIYIYDENFNTTDISLWKAHLQANPITLVYELAEPIETPLSEADIEALKNIKTFKGITYLTTDSAVQPDLDVEYVIDTKMYIDSRFETLASAIVNE